jgi:hypothetical protein
MTIAIRLAGDGIRAVLVICHSPALTGNEPGYSQERRGHLSLEAQYKT